MQPIWVPTVGRQDGSHWRRGRGAHGEKEETCANWWKQPPKRGEGIKNATTKQKKNKRKTRQVGVTLAQSFSPALPPSFPKKIPRIPSSIVASTPLINRQRIPPKLIHTNSTPHPLQLHRVQDPELIWSWNFCAGSDPSVLGFFLFFFKLLFLIGFWVIRSLHEGQLTASYQRWRRVMRRMGIFRRKLIWVSCSLIGMWSRKHSLIWQPIKIDCRHKEPSVGVGWNRDITGGKSWMFSLSFPVWSINLTCRWHFWRP